MYSVYCNNTARMYSIFCNIIVEIKYPLELFSLVLLQNCITLPCPAIAHAVFAQTKPSLTKTAFQSYLSIKIKSIPEAQDKCGSISLLFRNIFPRQSCLYLRWCMFDWINPLQFNRPSALCAQDLLSYSVSNREKVQRRKKFIWCKQKAFQFCEWL